MDCLKDCNGACCKLTLSGCTEASNQKVLEYMGWRQVGHLLYYHTKCRYLSEQGRCLIYDRRPAYCRLAMQAGDEICRLVREAMEVD